MASLFDTRVAGKLKGLLELPQAWVPPFFSISGELHRRYLAAASAQVSLYDLLDHGEMAELERLLAGFGLPLENNSLIVRSNAEDEGLAERGLLKSFFCDGTVDGILEGSRAVFDAAAGMIAQNPVGLIVQLYRSPVISGFLSNQRRVVATPRQWICEITPSKDSSAEAVPKVFPIRVERSAPAPTGELLCGTRRAMIDHLRAVGRYFYDRRTRRHLEWSWDGERLWIVQNDEAPEEKGSSPEPLAIGEGGLVEVEHLRTFRLFTESTSDWQKLQCVCTFRAAGLPTARLFVLKGKEVISALAKGQAPKNLSSDLNKLTVSPLVIRSDIRGETTLFAKHTADLTSTSKALDFLKRTTRQLVTSGIKPERICFIAHHFIPAAASAFSLATPRSRRVRIDALWGLPDGLEFCPHDSFEIDSRTGTRLGTRIRYKPSFLAALPSEKWSVECLGAPWDWKPALDNSSLREIARASGRLAEKLRKPVVTMWFAKVLPASGHPKLLPWRSLPGDAPSQIGSAVGSHFRDKPFLVRNRQDLALLEKSSQGTSSVVLRPDGPHLRDESFLKHLGAVVSNQGLRIDLEGSPLSHAFYVLQRTGARVACVDPINPKSVRQKFQKLVRDRIPVQIRRAGEHAETFQLPSDELLDVLKTKLVEESLEVLGSSSLEMLKAEMADAYEVLRALCRAVRQPASALERDAAKKRRKVGGFGSGIVLVETEDTPLVAVHTDSELFVQSKLKVASSIPKSVVAAGRRPKTQHDRIIVPLIPAVPSRLRGPVRVQIRHLGLTLKVLYKEKTVEIMFDKASPYVDPAQLTFPF
jgi:predicted house-cleaning noncanonical NTP pyrophosphatase (MazG superfamily)